MVLGSIRAKIPQTRKNDHMQMSLTNNSKIAKMALTQTLQEMKK